MALSRRSIRFRLTGWYAAALTVILIVFAGGCYFYVRRSLNAQLSAGLEHEFATIAQIIDEPGELAELDEHDLAALFRVSEAGSSVFRTNKWEQLGFDQALGGAPASGQTAHIRAANRLYRVERRELNRDGHTYEIVAAVDEERGILLESHAQNTLLELDHNYSPRRIIHRDFDCWIDYEARRRAGLDVPFVGSGLTGNADAEIEQHYSLVYDRFIGHEFFDYLLDLLTRYYNADEDMVRSRVRSVFNAAFPDQERFFPQRTMFYFSNEPQQGNEVRLVDMKRAPEWR